MADPKINQKLRVKKTENGATDLIGIKTIEVSNGTLSQPGGGIAKITTGGGGGGGNTYDLNAGSKSGDDVLSAINIWRWKR